MDGVRMTDSITGRNPIPRHTPIDDDMWDPRTSQSMADAHEAFESACRVVADLIRHKYTDDAARYLAALGLEDA
jgi:hypothetical protein